MNRKRSGCAALDLSGYDVRNNAAFQNLQAVLEHQLFLLHALNLQGIAGCCDHRVDCRVEIGVFLLQPRKFETNFRLILIRHFHRLKFCACIACANLESIFASPPTSVSAFTTFLLTMKSYYAKFDKGIQ